MNKLELLREINEIIDRLKGVDDFNLRKMGISYTEYLSPTEQTLIKLKNYEKELSEKENKCARRI